MIPVKVPLSDKKLEYPPLSGRGVIWVYWRGRVIVHSVGTINRIMHGRNEKIWVRRKTSQSAF